MTWLMSQMWVLLAIAGLFGLLFGWGMRGGLLRGRVQRAEVERGVAQTELKQARAEIEALYEAQRRPAAGGDAEALAARDERVASLSDQLSAKTAELDALIAERESAPPAGNGSSGALDGGTVSETQAIPGDAGQTDTARLEWRNRYLESRVRKLEADLSDRSPVAVAPVAAVEPEPAGSPDTDDEAGIEVAKLRWQNSYLNTRLAYFQNRAAGASAEAEPAPPEVSEIEPEPADDEATLENDAEAGSGRETVDEELARLRWRNRYLEGRLAYLEEERTATLDEDEASAPVAADPEPEGVAVSEPDPEPVAETPVEEAPEETEAPNETEAEPVPEPEEVVEAPAEDATEAAGTLMRVRPPALEGPRNGAPDDLTAIEGIGPRIQDVLNGIGVYHLDQIAEWTPENAAWIDDYLSFSGRVEREDWVGQASTRLAGATS